jgi:hypothetical protein
MTITRFRRIWRDIFPFIALAFAAWAVYLSAQRLDEVERVADIALELQITTDRESAERRDQMCRLFEGDHLQDITELRRTYERMPRALEFYKRITPPRLQPFVIGTVMADLRRLEQEAHVDSAPDFCDEHDVGLAEPDPVVPERPPRLEL